MDYSRDFFECVEQRNGEYNDLLYGADYNKGLQIKALSKALTSLDIKTLLEAINYKIQGIKIAKYQKQPSVEDSNCQLVDTYDSYVQLKDKKIVIYTCITGAYDGLKEPLLAFDNVEYVCFTDDVKNISTQKNTKWQIKEIPREISSKYNNTMSNRYIKMHPHELFGDADYAIYVDGSIKIVSFLGAFILKTDIKSGVAIFGHSQRDCLYNEAKVCIARKKGNMEAIRQTTDKYEKEGFPQKYGMYECGVIATDLKNAVSKQILEEWWNEFVDVNTMRDQLSLPYVVWKLGYQYTDVGILGNNIYGDERMTICSHR